MKICSHYHEEIVFDELKCPVCERMYQIDILANDLKDANEANAQLEKDCDDYRKQLENA